MNILKENELENIQGGLSTTAAIAIVSAAIFLFGLIDGVVHPRSCNE